MKWLADENIPKGAFLRQHGEDVVAIAESNPGICDEQVIGFARDQQRILLSFDRDHGDLIFGRAFAPPRAVVYLRLYPPNTETLEQILAGLMALGEKILDGQFTVISEDNMRQRALPGAS
ncbi:DUF5615 family PIN-like protein [Ferrovum sp.]|uniref:DUF5615 family PIN-like protein n=1 Tax=Ferrovum sp. TaxID=2609467 RepID=UPI00262B1EBC|nr:DUF5615 family PIN-like protein [Ferrovum sp.]